jgi:hypothetical protein
MPWPPPRQAGQGQFHQSNCIKKEIYAERTDAPSWLAGPGGWRCTQAALEWTACQYWLDLAMPAPHLSFTADSFAWPSWVTSPAFHTDSSLSAPFRGTTISPSPQPRSYNNRSTLRYFSCSRLFRCLTHLYLKYQPSIELLFLVSTGVRVASRFRDCSPHHRLHSLVCGSSTTRHKVTAYSTVRNPHSIQNGHLEPQVEFLGRRKPSRFGS